MTWEEVGIRLMILFLGMAIGNFFASFRRPE